MKKPVPKPGFYLQKSLVLCLVEYERCHPFWGTRTWKNRHCKCLLPDKWSIMSKVFSFGKWIVLFSTPAGQCNGMLCKTNPRKIRPLRWDIFSTSAILPFSPAPRDFHLFQSVKHFIIGRTFKSWNQWNITGQHAEFFKHVIENFTSRWVVIIKTVGGYFFDKQYLIKFNSSLFLYPFW